MDISSIGLENYYDAGIIFGLSTNVGKNITFDIPLKIGSGGIFIDNDRYNFIVSNPSVELGIKIIDNTYMVIGGGYKFVNKFNAIDKPNDYLNGWNTYLSLKIMKF